MVPAGISNRYQWRPKAPVEKPGVLSRGQWSRLRGTGWETGAFGLSQPVPKAPFLVVQAEWINAHTSVRKRSLACNNMQCGAVKPRDIVLCYKVLDLKRLLAAILISI